MLEEFYHFGVEWHLVIVNVSYTKGMASFIVQTLESSSNQSDFIIKRCKAHMEILNQEPINVRMLMADNVKFMVDSPQQACGNF